MTLISLVEALHLTVRCCEEHLDRIISGGYIGDLLSDVIANSSKDNVWITRQSHQNIVAIAELKEHAGIILVLGREPAEETIAKARKVGMPILSTTHPGFEVAGKIYELINK
jgi:predicted transcriptional regulator